MDFSQLFSPGFLTNAFGRSTSSADAVDSEASADAEINNPVVTIHRSAPPGQHGGASSSIIPAIFRAPA